MTMKKSPRFLFLGRDVEAVQTGSVSYPDVFTGPVSDGEITAAANTDKVWIRLPGREDSYETSMPWPRPTDGLVQIAPAVLEAVKADRDQNDNVLRQLRQELDAFLDKDDAE